MTEVVFDSTKYTNAKELKFCLHEFIDANLYDVLLYLDTDIVVRSDISTLFQYFRKNTFVGHIEYPYKSMAAVSALGGLGGYEIPLSAYFSPCINTGVFLVDTKLLPSVLMKWKKMRDSWPRKGKFYDQPAFNALVSEGQIEFEAFPPYIVSLDFPIQLNLDQRIADHIFRDKTRALEKMKETLAKLESAETLS
ncbi:hypothetical protein GW915_12560 [bacterium]|nr:hypothetical protein [bacterium]